MREIPSVLFGLALQQGVLDTMRITHEVDDVQLDLGQPPEYVSVHSRFR
jgi:hypothetical protein